jgi:hypothetical protein
MKPQPCFILRPCEWSLLARENLGGPRGWVDILMCVAAPHGMLNCSIFIAHRRSWITPGQPQPSKMPIARVPAGGRTANRFETEALQVEQLE